MRVAEYVAQLAGKVARYRVAFERRERGMLVGDYLPDSGEQPWETREVAAGIALSLAGLSRDYVNIHVVDARTYKPIDDNVWNKYP